MHTLCLPVVSSLADVYAGADVQAVICLLANMGEYRHGCSNIMLPKRNMLEELCYLGKARFMVSHANLIWSRVSSLRIKKPR